MIELIHRERHWRSFREARGLTHEEVRALRLTHYAGPPWRTLEWLEPSRLKLAAYFTLGVPPAFNIGLALYNGATWAYEFAVWTMQ